MRGWMLAPAIAALVLMGLPTAGAQEDEVYEAIEMEIGPDYLLIVITETIIGDDAEEVREEIDEDYGNSDGVVTSDEVARYRNDGVTFSDDQPECFDEFDLLRLDGDTPRRLDRVEQDVRNAVGAISEAELTEIVRIGFAYPDNGGTVEAAINLQGFGDFGAAIGCVLSGGDFSYYSGNYWNYYGGSYYGESHASGPQFEPLQAISWDARDDQSSDPSGSDPEFLFAIRAGSGHSLDRDSLRPSSLETYWEDGAIVAHSDDDMGAIASHGTFHVDVTDGTIFSGTAESVAWGALALFSSGVLVAGVAWTTEYGRWMLLRWLIGIPGFSRLEKDDVLEHDRRSEIYEFILQNPGACFTDIKERTELANGVLRHHLRVLETQEFVKAIRDGFRVRYYMRGPRVDPEPYLSRTQEQLLETVSANPGLTQKELAKLCGMPRHSVSYHTNKLADQGQLNVEPDGKWRRYFVNDTITV